MYKQLVIEIGTNSIKTLRAEYLSGIWQNMTDAVYPVRIGQNISAKGFFDTEAMSRNLKCLDAIMQKIKDDNNLEIHIIGTAGLRRAANANDFVKQIKDLYGIEVKILTGAEEAGYSYRGAVYHCPGKQENSAVIDIGGGSTELTIGQGTKILSAQSLPLGAVTLTEMCFQHDPVTPAELDKLKKLIDAALKHVRLNIPITGLIGVGGTVTTLAAISSENMESVFLRPDNAVLSLATIQNKIGMFISQTTAENERLPNMPPGRADIILAGSLILEKLMQQLGFLEIAVSTRGVRHGYLFSRIKFPCS